MFAPKSLIAIFLGFTSACFAQNQTWSQKSVTSGPQADYYPAMVYDSGHSQSVLFGGAFSDFSLSNETWTWDGSSWTKQSPLISPTARTAHAMAYDSSRGQVVLFGGASASGFLNDTWVWDGVNWAQKASGPGARLHVGMVFDAARQQVMLYGGSVGTPTPLGDTWVWDGAIWTLKFPSVTPGLRSNYRLAYDEAHAQVVLFGGWNGTTLVNETWVWDGSNWEQKFPVSGPFPLPRQDFGVAYDENLQQVVLFSGIQPPSAPVDDITWLWDGANWTSAALALSPPAMGGAAMTFDAARGQVVLFGGVNSTQFFNDTWVLGSILTAQIEPPINADNSSVFNSRRGIVPVKFTLMQGGSPTCSLPPAVISLFRTSGTTPGTINQSDYIMPADDGSNFRVSGCQYIYNLRTNLLGPGTYQVNISIGGVLAGSATFGIN